MFAAEQECTTIANDINHTADSMMTAGRIEDFPGDINKQEGLKTKTSD